MSDLKIRIMEKKDIPEAVDVLLETFTNTPTEPLYTFIGVGKEEMRIYREKKLEEHIDDGLSVVAVGDDGGIVGVICNYFSHVKKEASYSMEWLEKNCPKIKVGFDFRKDNIDPIFEEYVKKNNLEKWVEFSTMGVKVSHRGRGIGWKMNQLAFDLARKKGLKYGLSWSTNVFSRKVASKMKGMKIGSASFEDYEHGEEKKKVYEGCNQAALQFLKEKNKYKESFGDDICKTAMVYVFDLSVFE